VSETGKGWGSQRLTALSMVESPLFLSGPRYQMYRENTKEHRFYSLTPFFAFISFRFFSLPALPNFSFYFFIPISSLFLFFLLFRLLLSTFFYSLVLFLLTVLLQLLFLFLIYSSRFSPLPRICSSLLHSSNSSSPFSCPPLTFPFLSRSSTSSPPVQL
jgi:hypothetical protein